MKNKIDSLNSSKVPIIVFNKELEKLQDKVFFQKNLRKQMRYILRLDCQKVNWLQQVLKNHSCPAGQQRFVAKPLQITSEPIKIFDK